MYIKEIETNKLSSNFNPAPHIVESKTGGDVIIRNEQTGQTLRRNVIHLKRVEGQWKSVNDNEDGNRECVSDPKV